MLVTAKVAHHSGVAAKVGGRIIHPQANMNATDAPERVPVHTDATGVVRVAATRVTLDTVVGAFEAGATAEEIAGQYAAVPLVDVYSVFAFYLRHKPEVAQYLAHRTAQGERVREEVERRFRPVGLRERLAALRK